MHPQESYVVYQAGLLFLSITTAVLVEVAEFECAAHLSSVLLILVQLSLALLVTLLFVKSRSRF